jgi:hypothetical protein
MVSWYQRGNDEEAEAVEDVDDGFSTYIQYNTVLYLALHSPLTSYVLYSRLFTSPLTSYVLYSLPRHTERSDNTASIRKIPI